MRRGGPRLGKLVNETDSGSRVSVETIEGPHRSISLRIKCIDASYWRRQPAVDLPLKV